MAPREAGASYAAGAVLSSVAGRSRGERRTDACQRPATPEELERHIDGRRHGRPCHGDPQRLCDLAEAGLQLCREILESRVNRWGFPLWQSLQLLAHSAE